MTKETVEQQKKPSCIAIRKDGNRCTNPVVDTEGKCIIHSKDQSTIQKLRRRGIDDPTFRKGIKVRLRNSQDLQKIIAVYIEDVVNGRRTESASSLKTFYQLVALYERTLNDIVEKRIVALEQKLQYLEQNWRK